MVVAAATLSQRDEDGALAPDTPRHREGAGREPERSAADGVIALAVNLEAELPLARLKEVLGPDGE